MEVRARAEGGIEGGTVARIEQGETATAKLFRLAGCGSRERLFDETQFQFEQNRIAVKIAGGAGVAL
jgi:hypothetical protein